MFMFSSAESPRSGLRVARLPPLPWPLVAATALHLYLGGHSRVVKPTRPQIYLLVSPTCALSLPWTALFLVKAELECDTHLAARIHVNFCIVLHTSRETMVPCGCLPCA